jgi:hypothetical protein
VQATCGQHNATLMEEAGTHCEVVGSSSVSCPGTNNPSLHTLPRNSHRGIGAEGGQGPPVQLTASATES